VGDAVGLGDPVGGVAEEREREVVLPEEPLGSVRRRDRDADDPARALVPLAVGEVIGVNTRIVRPSVSSTRSDRVRSSQNSSVTSGRVKSGAVSPGSG
jgi:hypothetical protein